MYLHGEYWDARAAGPIAKGSAVRMLTVEGMSLVVEAADSPGGGAGEARGQTTV